MEENLREIITDITKLYDDSNDFDLSSHLINYYYTHFYVGKELDKVTLLYLDSVWLELAIWLGQNSAYLKQDKKGLKKVNKFFEKEITKSKIRTHGTRIKLFHNWLGGQKNLESDDLNMQELDILNSLLMAFPDATHIKDAKIALGLNETVEELQKQLKELKNVK